MKKEIVDYDLLNKNAGIRAALLAQLVEAMHDLPRVRLAAECLSYFYNRTTEIFEKLDAEARAVVHAEIWRALGLISSTQNSLLNKSMALTEDMETKDMFPETLMLMRASGCVIDLGTNYSDAGADDPVWVPPKGTNPRLEYSIEQGHWRCWDAQPNERTEFYTGHSPTSAYVAWRQGREWKPEAQ